MIQYIAPKFDGIVNVRQKNKLLDLLIAAYQKSSCIKININFLNNDKEIDYYIREIYGEFASVFDADVVFQSKDKKKSKILAKILYQYGINNNKVSHNKENDMYEVNG